MIAPPAFGSLQDHIARLGDVAFWRPWVEEALARHDLLDHGASFTVGSRGAYPTFLHGDLVVKLFGRSRAWRASHAAERDAYALLATDPWIAAPSLIAEGRLYEDDAAPWPYLITTRMRGASWRRAGLTEARKRSVAAELGALIKRVHALRLAATPPGAFATSDIAAGDIAAGDIAAAAARSSLPPHLAGQAERFLADLPSREPADLVFTHGDLVAKHVFVEDGRLAGVIDWGDAGLADRHYEIIQPHRDIFGCDKTLLRAFLDGADWPMTPDFPRLCLGFALHRQAVGLAQHHTMDVFEPIAALFPLADIATLDDLAVRLFAV
jgi:aminoglycoside phosphotransferase (APT) family kinase protein